MSAGEGLLVSAGAAFQKPLLIRATWSTKKIVSLLSVRIFSGGFNSSHMCVWAPLENIVFKLKCCLRRHIESSSVFELSQIMLYPLRCIGLFGFLFDVISVEDKNRPFDFGVVITLLVLPQRWGSLKW